MSLTNAQYDAIMRVYERRRTENHRIEEERRQKAYDAIPELRKLDQRNALGMLETVRRSLFGGPQDPRQAKDGRIPSPMDIHAAGGAARPLLEKLAGLTSSEPDPAASSAPASDPSPALTSGPERRALLKEHGFPEDYLEPVYTCPDCRDTGLIDGKHCHCFDREVVRLFYTQSGLEEVLRKENFGTLDMKYYPSDVADPSTGRTARDTMASVVSACKSFADRYPEESGFLLLYGMAGLGKTFLTHCIAKQLIDNGLSVIYYSAGELFEALAGMQFEREDEDTSLSRVDWNYLRQCDLLIIDDLGTELMNSFTASVFFRLLNERLSANRGMVISTNLTPAQLSEVYTERIYSRIVERFTILHVIGKDIRVQKRLNG